MDATKEVLTTLLLYSRIAVPDQIITDDNIVAFYDMRIAADLVELGVGPGKAKETARSLAYELAAIRIHGPRELLGYV